MKREWEIHVITDTAWQINMYCTVLLLYHIIVFIKAGVPIGTFCPGPYTYRGPKFQTTFKNLTSTFHSPIITSTRGPTLKIFCPGSRRHYIGSSVQRDNVGILYGVLGKLRTYMYSASPIFRGHRMILVNLNSPTPKITCWICSALH